MIKNRLGISIALAGLLSLATVLVALAGSTFDFGLIQGTPPADEANWTAWINESKNIRAEGMPNEIMTEDNTLSDIGVNLGYSQYDGDPEIEWILQVENFSMDAHGDDISLIFGGLGPSSGKLWYYTFTWDQYSNYETDHGTVLLSTSTGACPLINSTAVVGNDKTIYFSSEPSATYHVYKSTQPSGAGNPFSNGRYLYLKSVDTDTYGAGSFTDTEPLESWYVIIRANDTTNALDGCHSEEAVPTVVTLADFFALSQPVVPSVVLEWNTLSEVELVGFNIYRATDPAGVRQKLNTNWLPVNHPGQMVGDHYDFEDLQVSSGSTYYYWLEAIKLSGIPEKIGPRTATLGNWVFLPLLIK
jgi:hypothetical protein